MVIPVVISITIPRETHGDRDLTSECGGLIGKRKTSYVPPLAAFVVIVSRTTT